jgi:ATP-dependent Lhr-like helicase
MPASSDTVLQARALDSFHPAVRAWFEERFAHGPTPAQAQGWPSIQRRENTLIAAPTGSGKTLAAFLSHIDELYREARGDPSEDRGPTEGIRVVYVSPLEALVADIYENLERPLREIREVAQRLGLPAPELTVGMRTGDTPAAR